MTPLHEEYVVLASLILYLHVIISGFQNGIDANGGKESILYFTRL